MTTNVSSEFYQSFMQNVQNQQPVKEPPKDKKKLYLIIGISASVLLIIVIILLAIILNKPVNEDLLEQINPEYTISEQDKLYVFLDDVANERWKEANSSMSLVTLNTLNVCEKASYYRATIRLLNNYPSANVNREETIKKIQENSKECGDWDNTTGDDDL